MEIIGHRGAPGYEPENTLSSFERALELGVDMIEVDVHALDSGELVVIHDDKVDRTTNGSGYVLDHSFAALRQLDAGNGQKIPTLGEVVRLVDREVPVNIEIKNPGTALAVGRFIDRYIDKGWSSDDFVVSSFNHIELARFGQFMPDVRRGALTYGIPLGRAAFASQLHAYSVNQSLEFVDRAFVKDAQARSLQVHVYTVNDPDDIERMQRLGVDAIFTDYPDRAA